MRKSVLALALALIMSIDALPAGSAFASRSAAGTVSGSSIVATAMQYLGYPYTTVGNSPATGFSCIGFVSYVYQANGIPVPDNLGGALGYGPSVAFSNLMPGDVLFFQNTVWYGVSHAAIYLGGGRFIHAEWYNRGVVISSFSGDPVDGDYWMAKYLGATRPWALAPPAPPAAPASGSTTQGSSAPEPARPDVPAQPQLRDGPHALVEASGLNVRVRPSLFGPVLRVATGGTKVVILKQYRRWDWVQLPDASYGWVMGTGIGDGRTSPSSGDQTVPSLPLTQVEASAVRVHVRPNVAAPVIAAAYQGQKVRVLKRWSRWLRVLMADGTRGWMHSSFAGGASSQANGAAHRVYATHHVYAARWVPVHHATSWVTAGTRLRTRPGLHSLVITLAAPGTHIAVLRIWHNWVYGRLSRGGAGWVSRAFVHA
ncbi:MAG: hypothetical protein NVS2B16_32460 [Chloroflexota bacterium]